MLTFDVHLLINKAEGSREERTINEDVAFHEPELRSVSPLTARVIFMKLAHEIHVQLHDMEICAKMGCSRCLRKYDQKI